MAFLPDYCPWDLQPWAQPMGRPFRVEFLATAAHHQIHRSLQIGPLASQSHPRVQSKAQVQNHLTVRSKVLVLQIHPKLQVLQLARPSPSVVEDRFRREVPLTQTDLVPPRVLVLRNSVECRRLPVHRLGLGPNPAFPSSRNLRELARLATELRPHLASGGRSHRQGAADLALANRHHRLHLQVLDGSVLVAQTQQGHRLAHHYSERPQQLSPARQLLSSLRA